MTRPRIGGTLIPGTALTLLRRLATGDRLTGSRTFPFDWTFTQTPALAAQRSAKEVSAALVDTLVRTGLIARGEVWAVQHHESCAFSVTPKGTEAIHGRGFDPVPEQPELFP